MVKMTQKGQITLPKEIRESLDISPGDEVDFEVVDEDERQLKIIKAPSLSSLYGVLEPEKSFPGKEEIRDKVGESLGEEIEDE